MRTAILSLLLLLIIGIIYTFLIPYGRLAFSDNVLSLK